MVAIPISIPNKNSTMAVAAAVEREIVESFIYTINNTDLEDEGGGSQLITTTTNNDGGAYYGGDPYYDEHYIADVWVGVILTLLVLSCIGCVCSCLLYYKFQEWKRSLLEQHPEAGGGSEGGGGAGNEGYMYDVESLPSYTVVTGLPSYEEAMKQLQDIRNVRRASLITLTKQGSFQEAPPPLPYDETDAGATVDQEQSAAKTPRKLSLAEMFLRRCSRS